MGVGEHYRVTVKGSYLGKPWNNVGAFRQITAGCANEALALWEAADLMISDDFAPFANDQLTFDEINVYNMSTGGHQHIAPPTIGVGQRAALVNESPSYLAIGFRSNRFGVNTNYSYKRIPGLLQGDYEGNNLETATLTLANPIGDWWFSNQSFGGCSYVPVQLKSGWVFGQPIVENGTLLERQATYLTTQSSRK